MAQRVKNLPAMQETLVPSPGWEDLLEKGIAIHSSILASKIPWTEKLGGLQTMGSHEKAMAPHSSTLAWRIPWMEEPGGLQSMGSLGVRHN